MNPATQSLTHTGEKGTQVSFLRFEDTRELFLNMVALPGESPAAVFARYYRHWDGQPNLYIVRPNVLGRLGLPGAQGALYRLCEQEWPSSWMQPGSAHPGQVFGIQVHAVGGATVQRLVLRDRILGVVYEDGWSRHCALNGLRPENCRQSRPRQVRAVFDLAEEALAEAGLDFTDVYRTWFFLEDIQSWHDGFDEVRNIFYQSRGIFGRPLPASTEVGAGNGAGAALVADFLAMRPKCAEARYFGVSTGLPAQGLVWGRPEARAIAFNLPGQRRLFVASTATPRSEAAPKHSSDATGQMLQTLELIQVFLRSQGMGWRDTVRGLAYFSRWEDAVALEDWRAGQQLEHWPVLAVQTALAREDLRFGLELDAVRLG